MLGTRCIGRTNGPRAEGNEIRGGGTGMREEWFAPGGDLTAEEFGVAVWLGVGDEDSFGEGGDHAIALVGGLFRGAFDGIGERGQQQQAAFGQRALELRLNPPRQPARGADYDRVRTAQQNPQTLSLHRRMKAADDRHALIAPVLGKVVSLEDQIARAFARTKQRQRFGLESVEVAESGQVGRGVVAKMNGQCDGILCLMPGDDDARRHVKGMLTRCQV